MGRTELPCSKSRSLSDQGDRAQHKVSLNYHADERYTLAGQLTTLGSFRLGHAGRFCVSWVEKGRTRLLIHLVEYYIFSLFSCAYV